MAQSIHLQIPFLSNPDYHGHYMALLAGAEQDNNNGWHGILPDELNYYC